MKDKEVHNGKIFTNVSRGWQWEAATVPLIWQFLAARVGRKLLPDLNGGFPPSWTTKDYSVTMMGPLPS